MQQHLDIVTANPFQFIYIGILSGITAVYRMLKRYRVHTPHESTGCAPMIYFTALLFDVILTIVYI